VIIKNVPAVRDYIKSLNGFKNVTIIPRDKNLGLAKSIIEGVTQIVNKFGSVIVLEDDLVTSPYFLRFMNEGLELCKNEEKVISIHGYMYPHNAKLPETFFLRGADCLGWATWKRGWELFEPDGAKLLSELTEKGIEREFNFNNSCNNLRLLKNQVAGRADSWVIRWYASAFLKNKLTLYPARSLIDNIGNDYSGTHYVEMPMFNIPLADKPVVIKPIPLVENKIARQQIEKFFRKNRLNLYTGRINSKFLRLFHLINTMRKGLC